jgi:hypothetical protein
MRKGFLSDWSCYYSLESFIDPKVLTSLFLFHLKRVTDPVFEKLFKNKHKRMESFQTTSQVAPKFFYQHADKNVFLRGI